MGQPVNEPIMGYAPGSPEREALQNEMDRQLAEVIEIPCVAVSYTHLTLPTILLV